MQKTTKIVSITKIDQEICFDLEVEDNNNFFANCLLVHNSRLIAKADGLWTRKGKQYVSVPHIMKELQPFFDKNPEIVFDGELYNHDLKDDFNEIMSLVRKSKPTESDLIQSKEKIQFWIYDLPSELPFYDRSYQLAMLLSEYKQQNPDSCLKIVKTILCKNREHLDQMFDHYLENGFEGQMVRIDGIPYENKRVNHLLKRKNSIDQEFKIKRVEEGLGNRSGMAGAIFYEMPDGQEFGTSVCGGNDVCKHIWNNKESFEKFGHATVRYFGLTPDGKPRFGRTLFAFEGERDL